MNRNNRTQRIVLIDDSAEDRARLRAALLKGAPWRRYQFREADNGVDGLELCRPDPDWPIDCIITDVQMPRMSGLDILRQLKNEEQDFLPVPVIVLTGTSTAEDEASEALALGAQDYITKDGIHYTTVFRSIDNAIERHAMLQQLRRSERAAEAANRAKSALIGNISHEIRTPMTAVLGLSEVLLSEDIPDQHRPLLRMIRDNGAYLVEIVNDLLDLSKIEAGMLEIEPEPILLNDFLEDLISLMQVRAEENKTRLQLTRNDLPDAIQTDSVRLRQILLNLISNAIKFTPDGQVELSVSRGDTESPSLRFSVKDSGCGIPVEDQEAIFHPFTQSGQTGSRRVAGTGLGLSICRRLCDAMRGQISLESTVGEGSVFTVLLPLTEASADDVKKVTLESPSRTVEEILAGCHVLVAEDTPATQVLIQHFIQKEGGSITLVNDGQELVDEVAANPDRYQVIVSDVQMPVLNGLEATRKIRDLGCTTPIIILTADALAETREIAMVSGANEVVTKPIHRELFLSRIAVLCEQNEC